MTMISEEETGLIQSNNAAAVMMMNSSCVQQMTLSPTGVIGLREMKHGAYFELAGFLPCGALFIHHAQQVYLLVLQRFPKPGEYNWKRRREKRKRGSERARLCVGGREKASEREEGG